MPKVEDWEKLSIEEREHIAQEVYEQGKFVICLECGKLLSLINATHLKSHKITIK